MSDLPINSKEEISEFKKIEDEFEISHKSIETLVRYKKDFYVVFVDRKMDLDWATSDLYDENISNVTKTAERAELIGEIEFLQHRYIVELMPKKLKKHFMIMLAEVFTYILEKEYDAAKRHLVKICEFLEKRNYEFSRRSHVIFSAAITVLVFLVFGIIYYLISETKYANTTILQIIKFTPFGALGATMSIFQGVKSKEYNCESGKILNFIEIMVRITTGMVASLLAICLFNLEMIFTMFKSNDTIFEALIVICFVVGFSERFIPSIVKKFESSEMKGD